MCKDVTAILLSISEFFHIQFEKVANAGATELWNKFIPRDDLYSDTLGKPKMH